MSNNLYHAEDETAKLVEATVELLRAHRNDVMNGKAAADQARVYVELVKSACEALPVSEKDLAYLNAACDATSLAITATAACKNEGRPIT